MKTITFSHTTFMALLTKGSVEVVRVNDVIGIADLNSNTMLINPLTPPELVKLCNAFSRYLFENMPDEIIGEGVMTRNKLIDFLTSDEMVKLDPEGTLEITYGMDRIEVEDCCLIEENNDKFINLK